MHVQILHLVPGFRAQFTVLHITVTLRLSRATSNISIFVMCGTTDTQKNSAEFCRYGNDTTRTKPQLCTCQWLNQQQVDPFLSPSNGKRTAYFSKSYKKLYLLHVLRRSVKTQDYRTLQWEELVFVSLWWQQILAAAVKSLAGQFVVDLKPSLS